MVIVGAGFAGLAALRALRRAPVEILVVDRNNHHTFLPLLYQVATSGLSAQDISQPVRRILRRAPRARFRLADVVGVDLDERVVITAEGDRIAYDVLVLAAGSVTSFFGNAGAARHALGLRDLEDALRLRNRVLDALERAEAAPAGEREKLLGFVLVGGGPTGVELAGALAEMRRHVVGRDFHGLAQDMRVVLVEGRDRLLPGFPAPLCERALAQVQSLGVEVRLGSLVDAVDPDGVSLAGGERIPARTVVWAAGVKGAPVGAPAGALEARSGRIRVTPALHLPGRDDVYAVGDLALVEGAEHLPQMAPVAQQQGRHAAHNVLRRLRGEPALPFAYRRRPAMATIGRNRAVGDVFGVRLSGRIAWWAWLAAHIWFLAGFRNRAVVFVNWAYNWLTYDRGLRAMIGPGARGHP